MIFSQFFCVASAFLGGYVVSEAVNEIYRGVHGVYLAPHFVPRVLLQNPKEVFRHADDNFWWLFALWVFVFSLEE